MSAKAEKTEFIDNTARRKWDKEEFVFPMPAPTRFYMCCRYERRAKERAERDEAAVIEVICVPELISMLCDFIPRHLLTSQLQVKNFSQSHIERAPLVERDYKVNVEDRVGKCVVITSATPKNEQGGFYCEVPFVLKRARSHSSLSLSPPSLIREGLRLYS